MGNRRVRLLASAVVASLAAGGLMPTAAIAADLPKPTASTTQAPTWSVADVQRSIDQQLRAQPDGRQVGLNKIVWEKQGVEMEFALPGPGVQDTCSYQYVCLFGDENYNSGPDVQPWKLSFYYCTTRDLGDWGKRNQMTSWINNQIPGTWTSIHRYRDESHPEYGWIQMLGAGAFHADPHVGSLLNDRADVIDPC